MKQFLLAILLWSLPGCYVYLPVESATPDQGREVRVYLMPSQDLDVGPITVRDVTRVEGMVYRATSDTLAVWAQWFHSLGGSRYYANGLVHVMDGESVARIEVRTLHAARTILATVLTVMSGTAVFAFTSDLGGGGDPERSGEGTESRIAAPIAISLLPVP